MNFKTASGLASGFAGADFFEAGFFEIGLALGCDLAGVIAAFFVLGILFEGKICE